MSYRRGAWRCSTACGFGTSRREGRDRTSITGGPKVSPKKKPPTTMSRGERLFGTNELASRYEFVRAVSTNTLYEYECNPGSR